MKPNIILDLDETLLNSQETTTFDKEKYRKKVSKFSMHDMDGFYLIFERGHLQKFLDYIFSNFTVSVWTAGSLDYCLFIVEKIILIKPERKLDYIFFSYHGELSMSLTGDTKNLELLWKDYKLPGYNENNTIIVDNFDEVHLCQKHNCVIAKEFDFLDKGSENDRFLLDLIPKLEKMRKHIINGGTNPADIVNL